MKEWKELYSSSIILIDEASMLSKNQLHIINRALQDIMSNKMLFGGKTIILGGDFRQTLPIVVNATNKLQTIENCIKSSSLWKHFEIIKLTENMRCAPEEQ